MKSLLMFLTLICAGIVIPSWAGFPGLDPAAHSSRFQIESGKGLAVIQNVVAYNFSFGHISGTKTPVLCILIRTTVDGAKKLADWDNNSYQTPDKCKGLTGVWIDYDSKGHKIRSIKYDNLTPFQPSETSSLSDGTGQAYSIVFTFSGFHVLSTNQDTRPKVIRPVPLQK